MVNWQCDFSKAIGAKAYFMGVYFYIGFASAAVGIAFISFNGTKLHFNPKGDFLALLAAAAWAVYSVFSRKIGELDVSIISATRRIFFWGILFMLPAIFVYDFSPNIQSIFEVKNLLNFIYLGIGASAICFVLWNDAVTKLGAVKTSVYIYLNPVVTVVTSVIILHEQLTVMSVSGILLTLIGLVLSEDIILKNKHRSADSSLK